MSRYMHPDNLEPYGGDNAAARRRIRQNAAPAIDPLAGEKCPECGEYYDHDGECLCCEVIGELFAVGATVTA